MDSTARQTLQGTYDKYDLYTNALQSPMLEARYLASLTQGSHLREDFCGTASIARSWIRLSHSHTALAVDVDAVALRKAAHSAECEAPSPTSGRIRFANADATEFRSGGADVLTIPNSSIFLITDRNHLCQYLDQIWHDLNDGGAIAIDMFGGPGSLGDGTTVLNCEHFRCIWRQVNFDFSSNRFDAHVQFDTGPRTPTQHGFSYYMRLWSVPELVDMLDASGFERITVSLAATRDAFFNGHTISARTGTESGEWEQFLVGYKPVQR